MKGKRVAFIGESQCGKTTFGKKLMRLDSKPHKIVSIKNNFGEPIYMDFKLFLKDAKDERDVFLFIDEAKSFIKKSEEWMERHRPEFLELLRMAKEWNIFMIMVFHAGREIPVWLLPHLDSIERWETKEDKKAAARRFADFPAVANSFIKRPHLDKFEHVSLKIES